MIVVAITLVALSQLGHPGPLGALRSGARDGLEAVGSGVTSIWPFGHSDESSVQKQNDELRSKLQDAQAKLSTLSDVERERDSLRALFDLPSPDAARKIIARVTSIGATNYDATIELNKGNAAGIKVGMPVESAQGLVGRVIQTTQGHSTVLLVADTTADVSVRFARTGDVGAAVGQGMQKNLRVDLIELSSDAKQGDTVVTSGLDHSVYPPGIPVGAIVSSTAGPQDLRREVRIKPAVDFAKLEDVAVIDWRPAK